MKTKLDLMTGPSTSIIYRPIMHNTSNSSRIAMSSIARWVMGACLVLMLQACAVVAVADAAITVVATGVKVTAKAVGAVADVVIPDGDDDK